MKSEHMAKALTLDFLMKQKQTKKIQRTILYTIMSMTPKDMAVYKAFTTTGSFLYAEDL